MVVIVLVREGRFLGVYDIHEIAARQYRMIAVNEAVSIEVIQMIEDNGKLIHL